jgi:cardiolipin synthase
MHRWEGRFVRESEPVGDRVLTVPNALSLLRLLGVPFFLWLVLNDHDGWAVAVLMVSGFTDWLDGRIARRWNQTSRLGQLLDPAADRLYILATLVGLTVRGVVPLWLTVALVARDVLLATTLPVLRRHGYGPLPVHFLGKAATFNLLAGFPLLLLGDGDSVVNQVAHALGWAFAIWGTALYWWAGWLYIVQLRQVIAADRAPAGAGVT